MALASEVQPGSLVYVASRGSTFVRYPDGSGWKQGTYVRDAAYAKDVGRRGWPWHSEIFDECEVWATDLTEAECMEVIKLPVDAARAWAHGKSRPACGVEVRPGDVVRWHALPGDTLARCEDGDLVYRYSNPGTRALWVTEYGLTVCYTELTTTGRAFEWSDDKYKNPKLLVILRNAMGVSISTTGLTARAKIAMKTELMHDRWREIRAAGSCDLE